LQTPGARINVRHMSSRLSETIHQHLSEAWLRHRAPSAFHETPPETIFDPRSGRSWGPSDFDLNPDLAADLGVMDPPRPAAVLVPIVAREELTVLLTVRTAHLSSHAGQISFPGGKIDDTDESELHTALREAEEEIGLDRSHVEPLGYLDNYRTGTGYRVLPVVGLVKPGFKLSINENEVAEAFEVPLAFLMNADNHQRHSRPWRGRERHFFAMPYGERFIWGATAGMIKNMHERLLHS
jgi:8-oxo-dGTP pyrophosphatase MutT (NUDIX family)